MRGKGSYIDYFIYFLPVKWMKDVLLGMTSKNLEGSPVRWGEMISDLGLWILMYSVTTGGNRCTYWNNSYPSPFKGAPFILHSFTSFVCFDTIAKALSFTDPTTHLYRDNFWKFDK